MSEKKGSFSQLSTFFQGNCLKMTLKKQIPNMNISFFFSSKTKFFYFLCFQTSGDKCIWFLFSHLFIQISQVKFLFSQEFKFCARPKSHNLQSLLSKKSIFSHFISQCTISFSCKQTIASNIYWLIILISCKSLFYYVVIKQLKISILACGMEHA